MATNWLRRIPFLLALSMPGFHGAGASTIYGDLNNFDIVNDTGGECRGFQIEIHGARSSDITYTYDWNHYGAPRITEDLSDPANPRVFVRYESPKNPDGTWLGTARTDVPTASLGPTDGHFCTDTGNYSYGCEHFGVGYYGAPTAVKYHWLRDDGTGKLTLGPAASMATPTFAYSPPVLQNQAVIVPAQVVAAIPAPEVPIPANKKFGEPTWVKVIKTTTHNAGVVALADLVSDDDGNGGALWQNGEPAEVETEWKLLQTNSDGNVAKAEEVGIADDMGDGSDTVTRRYEFYKYAGALDTLDGETGEAMCDEANPATDPNDPAYLHGLRDSVKVTNASGQSYYVNCATQVVVGEYIGAQMAGFAAEAPLGLIDNLQDGEVSVPYTPRTVVVGGNTPFAISILGGSLPAGFVIGADDGVLSGTPTQGGSFAFTVQATDADNTTVSKAYAMKVAGGVVQYRLAVGKTGGGAGKVTGNGIDCGAACTAALDAGTAVSLTAAAAAGSVFTGWSGACAGTGACSTTMSADKTVTATFVLATQQYTLAVAVTGPGTVTSSPKGISCGRVCSKSFLIGTQVKLTAKPASKRKFLGWSGGVCAGTALTCTVPMLGNRNVQALFN